ncbi:hypothetical protein ABT084_01905 [Streptomyces sp. NPDC002138]|uniref:hypothetical protein n=1 Tax=Streptomyces sp. NPDC002138 TaxID=3154410 RepID=UPI003324DFC2
MKYLHWSAEQFKDPGPSARRKADMSNLNRYSTSIDNSDVNRIFIVYLTAQFQAWAAPEEYPPGRKDQKQCRHTGNPCGDRNNHVRPRTSGGDFSEKHAQPPHTTQEQSSQSFSPVPPLAEQGWDGFELKHFSF